MHTILCGFFLSTIIGSVEVTGYGLGWTESVAHELVMCTPSFFKQVLVLFHSVIIILYFACMITNGTSQLFQGLQGFRTCLVSFTLKQLPRGTVDFRHTCPQSLAGPNL